MCPECKRILLQTGNVSIVAVQSSIDSSSMNAIYDILLLRFKGFIATAIFW